MSDLEGAMKPMILEFGFPAYTRGAIQPEKQHRALREVWSGNGGSRMPGAMATVCEDQC